MTDTVLYSDAGATPALPACERAFAGAMPALPAQECTYAGAPPALPADERIFAGETPHSQPMNGGRAARTPSR